MSETLNHPTPDRLEAYVEGSLDRADAVVLESHLATCAGCEREVAELRSLFESLAALPQLAPSTGFAERVMAGVRVRKPWSERANEWVDRLMPSTTRGWAVATAMVATPVLVVTATLWWILSHPGVSADALLLIAANLASESLAGAWEWALASFASSTAAVWLSRVMELVTSIGRGGLGAAAAAFATMTVVSVYVLYENLFRPSARRAEHASYSF